MSDNSTSFDNPTVDAFGYVPLDAPAYTAMPVFFVLAALLHHTNSKFHPCKFMTILTLCALNEAVGYGLRVLAAHITNVGTLLVPTGTILLVPNAMALVSYIVVGWAMKLSGLNIACLRPSWIAWTFFISDVLAFTVQGFGAFLAILPVPGLVGPAQQVILSGLVIQCASLLLFIFVIYIININPMYLLQDKPDAAWLFLALYCTTVLLLVRSLFRVVEFASGKQGYARTHEWMAYALDCIPIMLCFIFYIHPKTHFGRCLNSLNSQFQLSSSEESPDETHRLESIRALSPVPTMSVARNVVVPLADSAASMLLDQGLNPDQGKVLHVNNEVSREHECHVARSKDEGSVIALSQTATLQRQSLSRKSPSDKDVLLRVANES
ncbi:hypothetical protein CEUSTIGMA_g10555.t1 [Chlamydomonas eustigma]|uniref:THH1/TOM1/TOM3 domain-containing protein n=1 Tax=Chlamydomonas eustigma TaxID=1157962 RepID=A0A250XJN0_9CHLO|nr:hypothetical protein CEUSTIGMA_g10555.t1 [Chlamydomonas eustigma]|eukprot:GAX83129.1 hypothetical protein CEUSTIGMA_g10555.t1 [Chlamydomonas eustigma]